MVVIRPGWLQEVTLPIPPLTVYTQQWYHSKGVRFVIFAAELNHLLVWTTDVGNAYLESYNQEKVYFIAGPEFAPLGLEGHILLIVRALYGLKSSGLRWWERLSDIL
jgi:hypothetical protein